MSNHLIKRYNNTIGFARKTIDITSSVLDLGVINELSGKLKEIGYNIVNTGGEDLDIYNNLEEKYGSFDVVTAFEILEHLVSPFEILRKLPATKLVATVPLKLWFAPAYKSKTDPRDRHFHEFEDWQFDWLLEKAGWEIIKKEKWVSRTGEIGIRPLLRRYTPRYYAVYAERVS